MWRMTSVLILWPMLTTGERLRKSSEAEGCVFKKKYFVLSDKKEDVFLIKIIKGTCIYDGTEQSLHKKL